MISKFPVLLAVGFLSGISIAATQAVPAEDRTQAVIEISPAPIIETERRDDTGKPDIAVQSPSQSHPESETVSPLPADTEDENQQAKGKDDSATTATLDSQLPPETSSRDGDQRRAEPTGEMLTQTPETAADQRPTHQETAGTSEKSDDPDSVLAKTRPDAQVDKDSGGSQIAAPESMEVEGRPETPVGSAPASSDADDRPQAELRQEEPVAAVRDEPARPTSTDDRQAPIADSTDNDSGNAPETDNAALPAEPQQDDGQDKAETVETRVEQDENAPLAPKATADQVLPPPAPKKETIARTETIETVSPPELKQIPEKKIQTLPTSELPIPEKRATAAYEAKTPGGSETKPVGVKKPAVAPVKKPEVVAPKKKKTVAQSPEPQATSAPKRRCEKRAFEVNDFGKEGPIKLARKDLANYVEKIKKRENVSNVRVSTTSPECRLFLWLGPASEYTCRIEATMCW